MKDELERIDKLTAMMLLMFSCSEVMLTEIEKELARARCKMKHEPKMLINRLIEQAKGMHAIYDRLYELSVSCGTAIDDMNVVDAFLTDKNLFLRFFMMAENALHGDTDNTKTLQLDTTLKLMAKDPVFKQEYIDKLTNFQ